MSAVMVLLMYKNLFELANKSNSVETQINCFNKLIKTEVEKFQKESF